VAEWRLFDGVDGPANAVSYTGNFIAGMVFTVTTGGCWFDGYWYWVASGAPTLPQKCALWTYGDLFASDMAVVPGSVVTSGTLTAGWNFIPLDTPIQLSIQAPYIAAVGVNGGFNSTQSSFNTGDTYAAGITSGPLLAYSGPTGSSPSPSTSPTGLPQGLFSVAGSDPETTMPGAQDSGGDGATNFWVDVQISNVAPTGYDGSYRLMPGSIFADTQGGLDDAFDYNLATEFAVSEPCDLNAIWFFSPKTAVSLPTECAVWDIGTQSMVAQDVSPSWSGEAASGWVSCSFSGVTLESGKKYKVAAYNGNGTNGAWSYKRLGFWDEFSPFRVVAPDGISNGPLSAPGVAAASMATVWQGSTTEPGQSTFSEGPPETYPGFYVDDANAAGQFYGVDVEVTPTGSVVVADKNLAVADLTATNAAAAAPEAQSLAAGTDVAIAPADRAMIIHVTNGGSTAGTVTVAKGPEGTHDFTAALPASGSVFIALRDTTLYAQSGDVLHITADQSFTAVAIRH
jgi:hypothetical protein